MSLLEFTNVVIGYENQTLIKPFNCQVNENEIIVLLGKNGSGKTSLFKTILGIQPAISGNIFIQQKPIESFSAKDKSKQIAAVFSRMREIPKITVNHLLELGRIPFHSLQFKLSKKEIDWVQEVKSLVGIQNLSTKYCDKLSDGQLQKVMIARAIIQDSPLILLDEPSSHLDLENQYKIFELLYNLKEKTQKTFIISTHQVEIALQITDKIWWIDHQQIHHGFPEQIGYEKQILNQFSSDSVRFDYTKEKFAIQKKSKYQIQFNTNCSELSFWTKHALERLGFDFPFHHTNQVSFTQNNIEFKIGNEFTECFLSIESFIRYLKKNICEK